MLLTAQCLSVSGSPSSVSYSLFSLHVGRMHDTRYKPRFGHQNFEMPVNLLTDQPFYCAAADFVQYCVQL
eukprot:COSAG01_NODE_5291_length_4355_cov_4.286319_3_plen_70_part_00